MESKLTYHYKVAIIKDNFLITDFGEISIEEITKEYDSLITIMESNPDIIQDFDYLYELQAIVEEVKRLKDE